jgi:hypothetical protein
MEWAGNDVAVGLTMGLESGTTNSTVTMAWEILDRMERAVVKARG